MKRLALAFLFCFYGMLSQFSYGAMQEAPTSLINEDQFRLYYINIYESEIYESYHTQLQTFAQHQIDRDEFLSKALASPPEEQIPFIGGSLEFIQMILKPLPEDSGDRVHFHEQFITELRKLINEKNKLRVDNNPLTHALIRFIDRLTVWMFTEVDLSDPARNFMYSETDLDKNEVTAFFNHNPLNFIVAIQTFFEESPRFSEKEKPAEMLNDPVLYGDVPAKLFKLTNKKTEVIRTANVARDAGPNDSLSILNEEFRNYLMVQSGRLHFYVNILPRTGDDSDKTRLIEELENDPLVRDSFAIITFPKQKASNFYFQKGEYADLTDAFQFKQVFFTVLFTKNGEFYWSKKIDMGAWRKQVLKILDSIHKDFFEEREELDLQERLDFIEIAYVRFIDALVNHLNPDVLNVTCKQSVDRGPSLYMLLYMYDRLKNGSSLQKEHQNLYWLFFSPPIAFHNRPGHDYRIARFQAALNRMLPYFNKK